MQDWRVNVKSEVAVVNSKYHVQLCTGSRFNLKLECGQREKKEKERKGLRTSRSVAYVYIPVSSVSLLYL